MCVLVNVVTRVYWVVRLSIMVLGGVIVRGDKALLQRVLVSHRTRISDVGWAVQAH